MDALEIATAALEEIVRIAGNEELETIERIADQALRSMVAPTPAEARAKHPKLEARGAMAPAVDLLAGPPRPAADALLDETVRLSKRHASILQSGYGGESLGAGAATPVDQRRPAPEVAELMVVAMKKRMTEVWGCEPDCTHGRAVEGAAVVEVLVAAIEADRRGEL